MLNLYGLIALNLYCVVMWFLVLLAGGTLLLLARRRDNCIVEALLEDGIPNRKVARAMAALRKPYRYLLPSMLVMICLWFQGHALVALPGAPAKIVDDFRERRHIANIGTPVFIALSLVVHYAKILWYRNILKEMKL